MFKRAPPITIKMPVLQTPESFKGGSFKAGLSKHCTSLTLYSLVTVAITTFDLTTDWLAFVSIRELRLDERLRENNDRIKLHSLYIALPQIFLAFCILASVIYAIDVIHYFYKFGTLRKKFYDKRDGVKSEDNLVEKFGGEACVLLLVIFEDLPVSLLILAILGLVSCHCILMLNTAVLYLCIVATVTSVLWKLIQVLWSSGCFGKRYEYHSNRIISAARIVSSVLLLSALGVNILNSVLIKPNAFIHHLPQSDHSLFDKVFIDQWIERDQVMFTETVQYPYKRHPRNPVKMKYATITSLNAIIMHSNSNASVTVTKKCSAQGSDMNFTKYMTTNDSSYMQDRSSECEAMFLFYYNATSETIVYDYGYRILRPSSGIACVSGSFEEFVMMHDEDNPPAGETSTESYTVSSNSSYYTSPSLFNSTDTTASPSSPPMELSHHITLMSSMEAGTLPVHEVMKPCQNIQIAHQSMRSFNPCLFVKSEM